jgi:hypothetical protein
MHSTGRPKDANLASVVFERHLRKAMHAKGLENVPETRHLPPLCETEREGLEHSQGEQ